MWRIFDYAHIKNHSPYSTFQISVYHNTSYLFRKGFFLLRMAKAFVALLLLSLLAFASCVPSSGYSEPDLILVIGQNQNNSVPAGAFGPAAVQDMMTIQGWSIEQVTAYYNEARAWYASQFGIFFDDVNPLGQPNTIYNAISRDGRAGMSPLSATASYHVYGVIEPGRFGPVSSLSRPSQGNPAVKLIEYVVRFDLTGQVPNFTFTPWSYGGVYGAQQAARPELAIVSRSDNLAVGIYRINGYNFYMRVPVPNKTTNSGTGTSRESNDICSPEFGSALGALRVDAFSFAPNADGKYPASTLGVWSFYRDVTRTAKPSLYTWQPQVFPGNDFVSCYQSDI